MTLLSTDAARHAWDRHVRALNEAHATWLDSPWTASDLERNRALFQVLSSQHIGFNTFVTPRQDFPYFSKSTMHHPIAFSWGDCCPDFHYQWCFIDGAGTYRITGRRGTRRWSEFHLQAEFWGDPQFRQMGVYDLDDFTTAADGTFEIILSSTPHAGNWIGLDTTRHNLMIVVRDAMYEWSNDTPTSLHIDTLDCSEKRRHVAELDLGARLDKLSSFLITSATHWVNRNIQIVAEAGVNRFWEGAEKALGGIQHAAYQFMLFDIGEGDALIIEADAPATAKFWAVQLSDLCHQTIDYLNHQSSLNASQIAVDPDGKARFVLAHSDPGVANWLDTGGNLRGIVMWRWVHADIAPLPSVQKTALAEARQYLHPETPEVSLQQRRDTVAARCAGIRRMYGM